LKQIAQRVHMLTKILAAGLEKLGFTVGQASRLSPSKSEIKKK